jgi:exopolysaccharide biosynthesis WecB/TagA/CpsF family protein
MDILSKIYTQSPQQAIQDIATQRENNSYSVVHFLYFANSVRHKLFDSTSTSYKENLLDANFLLPDGIALQIFYRCAVMLGRVQSDRSWLYNCNGTDFTLPLLQFLNTKYPRLVIHLYGWTASMVDGAQIFLHDQWLHCGVLQDWYTWRDREYIAPFSGTRQVLLVARWTPLQESRIQENMADIQKNNILVLSVGWLFAFRSGEEKRTPKLFRGRAERLWRLFANPRKNAIKVRYSLYLPYAIIRYLLLKR